MLLKSQNEQEVQSQLVGYRWSITQTKRLNLEKDETDNLFHCPTQECDHDGFQSQRGCRKHVNNEHSWLFYFDAKPNSTEITDLLKLARNVSMVNTIQDQTSETTKHAVKLIPPFSLSCDIGEVFTKWLTGSGGGCKKDRAAQQIVTRCFKFLRFCCEEEELTFDVVDFSLCSPNSLFKFIDYLQDECKLGHGGRLGYIDAISEMIDCNRAVPQKSAKDRCKDDAIAVDTRFRH